MLHAGHDGAGCSDAPRRARRRAAARHRRGRRRFMLAVGRRLARHWPEVELTLLDRTALIEPRRRARLRGARLDRGGGTGRRLRLVGEPAATKLDVMAANLFLHHFEAAALRRLLSAAAERARSSSPSSRAAALLRSWRRGCCRPSASGASPATTPLRAFAPAFAEASSRRPGRPQRAPSARSAASVPSAICSLRAAGKKEVAREDARREVRRHRDRRRAGGQCDGHPAGARRAPRRAGRERGLPAPQGVRRVHVGDQSRPARRDRHRQRLAGRGRPRDPPHRPVRSRAPGDGRHAALGQRRLRSGPGT